MLVVGLGAAGIAVAKILSAPASATSSAATARAPSHTDRADYQDGTMPPSSAGSPSTPTPRSAPGEPEDVIDGADVFIGLSGPQAMPAAALKKMNRDAMVFAMSNPTPEITPEEAEPYARVIATGRSDYPNQINNVLCFPGIFRGALDVRAREITEEMKMAAARGIASIVTDDELREDYVIPCVFNRNVCRRRRRRGRRARPSARARPTSAATRSATRRGETTEFRAIRP